MRTEKQIAASRANGARSRGPKSPRTSLTRKAPNATPVREIGYNTLARAIVFRGESRRAFEDLIDDLIGCLRPESSIHHLLIGKMAVAHWRQLRLWYRERDQSESLGADENRLDRQFYRALDRYLSLKNNLQDLQPTTPTKENTSLFPEPEPKPGPEPTGTHAQPPIAPPTAPADPLI